MVIPGLINAHTHSVQNLFRGLGDDKSLQDWLSTVIYPLGEIITPDDVYAGAKISYLEMLKSGVTTVIDHHKDNRTLAATRKVVKAAEEISIRAFIARGMRVRTDRCAAWDVPLSSTKWSLKQEIKMMGQLIKEINRFLTLKHLKWIELKLKN